jgi:hypothetical protein
MFSRNNVTHRRTLRQKVEVVIQAAATTSGVDLVVLEAARKR